MASAPAPRGSGVERALADLLADPRPAYHRPEQTPPIWLLFVHLDTLHLSADLADSRFQIWLRYGGNGRYMEKYSQKVRSSHCFEGQGDFAVQTGAVVVIHSLDQSPELNGNVAVCEAYDAHRTCWNVRLSSGELKAVSVANLRLPCPVLASFGAMLIFRWDPELPPIISLHLMKLGFFDSVLSQTRLDIPFADGRPGIAQQELLFAKHENTGCCLPPRKKALPTPEEDDIGFIGHLGVAIELRMFTIEQLQAGMSDPFGGSAVGTAEILSMLSMLASSDNAPGAPGPSRMDNSRDFHPPVPTGYYSGNGGGGGMPVVVGRPVPGMGWSMAGQPIA